MGARGSGAAVAVCDGHVPLIRIDLASVQDGAEAKVAGQKTGESGYDAGCDKSAACFG